MQPDKFRRSNVTTIRVRNLSKQYEYYNKEIGLSGSIKNLFFRKKLYKDAVNGVSFDIEQGSIIGLIGLNGAGKSTLIKMLSGILKPSSGEINVLGFVPFERKREFLNRIAMVAGNRSQLWWDIPAIDSFQLIKTIYNINDSDFDEILNEITEMLNVKHLLHVQLRRLSLGERMKMEIIASLLYSPDILYLDEPTIGLDIFSQVTIRKFLWLYNKRYKTTIIITSHNFDDFDSLCDRLIVIDKGYIKSDLGYDEFINKYATDKTIVLSLNEEMVHDNYSCLEKWNYKKVGHEKENYEIKVQNDESVSCLNELISVYGSALIDISIKNMDLKEIIQSM